MLGDRMRKIFFCFFTHSCSSFSVPFFSSPLASLSSHIWEMTKKTHKGLSVLRIIYGDEIYYVLIQLLTSPHTIVNKNHMKWVSYKINW